MSTSRIATALALALSLSCGAPALAQPREPALGEPVQLTTNEDFLKAGEAYFSPDQRWIIFQAIPAPAEGEKPGQHYSMYVARLMRDGAGRVTGLDDVRRLSSDGSANTCGFFNPTKPYEVIYGSTVDPVVDQTRPGYQRGQSRYAWAFPGQMDIVVHRVPEIFKDWSARNAVGRSVLGRSRLISNEGYDAECAFSPDGRFIVYANVDPETRDADLYIHDVSADESWPIVEAEGYDGGPFFSPDGKRLCYRSDRAGNDLLQIFVADLEFDEDGRPIRVAREHQLTANRHVNWAPFWSPDGEFLVYTTSEVGHHNYEVFAIAAPEVGAETPPNTLPMKRITEAEGFDGLPVLSPDGALLMWTSQRGPKAKSGDRASQLFIAEIADPEALDPR